MSGQQFSDSPTVNQTLNLLLTRRSVVAQQMIAPGPSEDEVRTILTAGMRVPDHGKLEPWRFIVLDDKAQAKVDQIIEKALDVEDAENDRKKALNYASQAPLCIVVISSVQDRHPIPEWEQILSAGAVCQTMIIAATALGYASQWLTGWPSYSRHVATTLGLLENEHIAGLLFFGSRKNTPSERPRPDFDQKVQWGIR